MNTRKLVLIGAVAAIGLLGTASIGVAFADSGTGPTGWGMGHMGSVNQQVPAACDQTHDQMQAAIAKALGITVDDLNVQIAAGKTVADIATAKGLDFATVMQQAMTTVHGDLPGGYGPGSGAGMMGGRGSNIN
ncbi:MAG TPA: hypothetical protein VIK11_00210 [Tepidiformaceae bacterium]|jgi:hypothetical protein